MRWIRVSRQVAPSRRLSVREICKIHELRILTDHIAAVNVTDTTCGASIRDRTSISVIVPAVGMSVTLVLIILRLYVRLVVNKLNMEKDDWATVFLGVRSCTTTFRRIRANCYSVVRCQSTSGRSCVSKIGYITLSFTSANLLTAPPVAKAGLGRDMWTLEFTNITRVFYVRFFTSRILP